MLLYQPAMNSKIADSAWSDRALDTLSFSVANNLPVDAES